MRTSTPYRGARCNEQPVSAGQRKMSRNGSHDDINGFFCIHAYTLTEVVAARANICEVCRFLVPETTMNRSGLPRVMPYVQQ